jgi:hypothetical protein
MTMALGCEYITSQMNRQREREPTDGVSGRRNEKSRAQCLALFIFLSILDDLNAPKGPRAHTMSPPLLGWEIVKSLIQNEHSVE